MSETAQLPSYDDVQQTLETIDFPLGEAECHGLASGIISATDNPSKAKETLLNLLTSTDNETITIEPAKTLLTALCDTTAAQLADINFGFQLLLPNDDVDLATRSKAISAWCRGFIAGLEQARSKFSTTTTKELQEITGDLNEITRIDVQAINDTEAEEVAFSELVEYVRFAVMTTYTDLLLENKNRITTNTPQKKH